MRKRASGAFVAVVVAFCATVAGREGHALPANGFIHAVAPAFGMAANGYVERYPTPRGGLLAQVVQVFRMDDICSTSGFAPGGTPSIFNQDCDWNVVLRPPTCTDTHLGRDCNKARDEFIDFFWNGSSQGWRAVTALHMFRAFREKLRGSAGYQECNLEASGVSASDKAKYRERLSGDADIDDAAHKTIPKPAEAILAGGLRRSMLKNLAYDIEKDLSLQAYVKGMWRQTLTSTPAFNCWWDRTPNAAHRMPTGEVQLSQHEVADESKKLPLGQTLLSECEKDQATGLCTRDILVHGLYVWDMNHGGATAGQLELHPIHAMVAEQKTDFSSEVKFAVFADDGKAARSGGGWVAGYIDDTTPPLEWFTGVPPVLWTFPEA